MKTALIGAGLDLVWIDEGKTLPWRFSTFMVEREDGDFELPEDQREVIILRHYADMSFKEIAAATNCSINTALGRMRYGLINLRKLMVQKQIAL